MGTISPPINGSTPAVVPGQTSLTQALGGNLTTSSYLTHGYYPVGSLQPYFSPAPAPSAGAATATTTG